MIAIGADYFFSRLEFVKRQLHAHFASVVVDLSNLCLQIKEGNALDGVVLSVSAASTHGGRVPDHLAINLQLARDVVASLEQRRDQLVVHVVELDGAQANRVAVFEPERHLLENGEWLDSVLC